VTCRFEAINVVDPMGGGGGDVGDPHSLPAGTQVWRSCFDASTGDRVEGPTLYTSTGPGGGGAPDVTARLVDSALANIDVDLPAPRFSPPGETIPNFETWLWTDDTAAERASASAAGVTVTVEAELTGTRFEFDDGVTVRCDGRPVAYDPAGGDRQRTTCSHRFAAPTRDLTVDVTSTWRLRWWATNGEGGDLGTIDRSTTVPYRVQVKETVIRSGR